MSEVERKRIEYLDAAKGFGIFLVVLGHLISPGIINQVIYSFHMPLFFFVSGILLNHKMKTMPRFTVRKCAKSLMIPYLVFSALYLVFYEMLINKESAVGIVYMLYQTLCCRGMAPLWFLASLFFAEIVFLQVLKYNNWVQVSVIISLILLNLITYRIDLQSYSGLISNPITFVLRTSLCILFVYAGGYLEDCAI